MVLQPHKAPWEGEEGMKQVRLGIKNGCMLAKNFIEDGYDVVILDVITDKLAKVYKENLKEFEVKICLLLPTFEEIQRRNAAKETALTEGRIKQLYEMEEKFTLYDNKIDNTALNSEHIASDLNKYLNDTNH